MTLCRHRLVGIRLLAVAAVVLIATRAPAQLVDRVAAAPEAARSVLVIDDARALWTSVAGRLAASAGESSDLFAGTRKAWASLAERLGVDEAEAARLLIAGPLWIAVDRPIVWNTDEPTRIFGSGVFGEDAERADWAIITRATVEGLDRVRRRLKPTVRAAGGGAPVYAIEGGRYLLSFGPAKDGTVDVLIGPGPTSALFTASQPLLSGERAKPALGADRALAEARLVEDGSGAVLVSFDPDDGSFQAAGLRLSDTDVSVTHRSSVGACWGPAECCGPDAGLWDPASVDALLEDVVIGVVGVVPTSVDERAEMLAGVLKTPVIGQRVSPFVPLLGRRLGIAFWRRNELEGGPKLGAGVVMELNKALGVERGREIADQLIGRSVRAVHPDPAAPSFAGRFPRATRTLPVGGPTQPVAAWRFDAAGEGPTAGEWMGFAFDERDSAVAWVDMASCDPAEGGDGVVSGGVFEVARVFSLLGEGFPLPAAFDALREIERIEYRAVFRAGGGAGGEPVIQARLGARIVER